MTAVEKLITDNLDIWSSAIKAKATTGRWSTSKRELYGISKLRNLILQLAFSGSLTDRKGESSELLLEKISTLRNDLIKKKILRKTKDDGPVTQDETRLKIPNSWNWARLGQVFDVRDGTHDSPKYLADGYPLVTSKNIYSRRLDLSNVKYISEEDYLKISERSKVDKGDILFAMIGSIGNAVIIDIEPEFSVKNVGLFKYYDKDLSNQKYLLYYLQLAEVWFKEEASGAVQSFVSLGKLRSYPFPLAPLEEQYRIVAKVDELMALCDALETQQENSIAAHQTLVETLLAALTNTSSPEAFSQAWSRIAKHFDTLFTTEHSIDQLKQTILQLAVMGKLVPQDPRDEPASVLLEKIAAEKERLVKEKKIKKQKELPEIGEDDKPFELPLSWELSYCKDLCYKITDGEHATPKRAESGHYLLSARNVTNEGILLHDVDYVPDDEFKRIRKRCDPNIGDILISCSGSVGRIALVDRDDSYSMVRSAAMIRPDGTQLSIEYLAFMLRSPFLQIQIKNKSKQQAQANLFLGAISSLVFILPPLNEQKRIVARVDELMALCDRLKTQIGINKITQLHLADTMVDAALNNN